MGKRNFGTMSSGDVCRIVNRSLRNVGEIHGYENIFKTNFGWCEGSHFNLLILGLKHSGPITWGWLTRVSPLGTGQSGIARSLIHLPQYPIQYNWGSRAWPCN